MTERCINEQTDACIPYYTAVLHSTDKLERRVSILLARGRLLLANTFNERRSLNRCRPYYFIRLAHCKCKSLMFRSSRLSVVCLSVCPASDLDNQAR